MGGVIEVESAPGRGSAFAFTVELGVGKGSARALPFPDLRGLRVLVVDDNKTSREILERSLGSLTFQVRTAASGAQALVALADAEARGAPFELVLLDWQMPEMDGFEVARRIRSDERFARRPLVFMITAFGRQEMMEKAGDLVPDALLVKPLSRSALIDALMRALSGAREPATAAPVRAAWAGTGGGARVLVVEDNEVNRQVVSELLEIRRLRRRDGRKRTRGARAPGEEPGRLRGGLDGCADAGDGRLPDRARDPQPAQARPADCRAHRARLRIGAAAIARRGDERSRHQAHRR